jgi:hypothetical protein
MVECNLPKVEVAGSSPVSRSRLLEGPIALQHNDFVLRLAGAPALREKFQG